MTTEKMVFSTLAIPPGDFLEELLEDVGMTKGELALRIGKPLSAVSAIYTGEAEITPEIALQLGQITDVPGYVWLNLEKKYRLTLARNREQEEAAYPKQA